MTPLGRPRRRGEDNIKMDIVEIRWMNIGKFHLAQDWNN
jgi:hypothetical protein